VIAIIALLVSILVPSLRRARELASTAVCLAHGKALGLGLGMYVSEFHEYPGIMGDMNETPWWPVALYPFVEAEQQFRCPKAVSLYSGVNSNSGVNGGYPGGWSVDNLSPPVALPYWATYHGNRMHTWSDGSPHPGKRGFCWNKTWPPLHSPKASAVAPDTIYIVDGKIQTWTHASIWVDTPGSHMSPDYNSLPASQGGLSQVGDYHLGSFNALFADSHAETIEHGTTTPRMWSIQVD